MLEHETNLPEDDEFSEGERESQDAIRACFGRSGSFILRVPDAPPDRGADGSIELRKASDKDGKYRATGKRAWFQLKHTSSPIQLADGSVSYPIETKNIRYLGNHPCPFYILYIRSTNKILFRWLRDVRAELDRDKARWDEHKEVRVRFRRVIDDALLKEIETEIESYALQAEQLFDGPRFMRDVTPERARRLLEPDPLFVKRAREIGLLQDRMGRGRVVPLVGIPDAGKSELVRHCLSDPDVLKGLGRGLGEPLSLLVVDVGVRIEPRILRGLAYAIGLQQSWVSEHADQTQRIRERAALFWQGLPSRSQGQHLVTVIENAHHCLGEPEEREDLDELLASDPFRTGCTVIVTCFGSPPNGKGTRALQADTEVGPIAPEIAKSLLIELEVEAALATSVIKEAVDLPELLLPGVIKRGATAFGVKTAAGLIKPKTTSLLNELIDAASYVAATVLRVYGYDSLRLRDGPQGWLRTLIAMAFLSRQPITEAELHSADLQIPPLLNLRQIGWIENVGLDAFRLTGFGCRSLRRLFCQELKQLKDSISAESDTLGGIADAIQRLMQAIATGLGEEGFDEFSQAIEEATAWARESGLSGTRVEAILLLALMPYVVDDIFFPVPEHNAAALQRELRTVERSAELGDASAALVLTARSDAPAEEFLKQLRVTVEVAAGTPRLLAIHVRALDIAATIGQRRHHRFREIFEIRRKFLSRLLSLNEEEKADIGVLKWSASWQLNATLLAIAIGESQHAQSIAEAARTTVRRLPQARTLYGATDRLWLESRLALIESRLQVQSSQREEKLREAMDIAFAALALAPTSAKGIRYAFRAARRLSEELRSDKERDQLLIDAYERLDAIFGNSTGWPLAVLAQATALARDVGSLSADPECRLQQVRRGLTLIEPAVGDAKALAQHGDTRVLLVLARATAFAATCNDEIGEMSTSTSCRQEALQLVRNALNAAPSAAAWELYLRLIDQQKPRIIGENWQVDELTNQQSDVSLNLRHGIKEARAFLDSVPFWNADDGHLALWCWQRLWQSQGSLERWAARQQNPNEPWIELAPTEKRRVLERKHRERQAALDNIERKSGPHLKIYMARARNEAQFQRLVAIYSNHVLNSDAVIRHFNDARVLYPDSHALLAEEGRFRRYVWDFPGAVIALRRVVMTATRGSLRQEAAADLAEVLITATTHCERLEFDDSTVADARDLVHEARELLSELLGFRNVSHKFSILRDRADLESGVSLDWNRIDEAYQAVVDEEYTTTIIENLPSLRIRRTEVSQDLADLVIADFTGTQTLRGLGSLYLRRAELGVSPEPVRDCQRAYNAFDACRILETAQLGSARESVTTSYQLGRSIIVAAKATGMLNPFEANLKGRSSLVNLACALFGRTASLTVGLFHEDARRRQSEAARLANTLKT